MNHIRQALTWLSKLKKSQKITAVVIVVCLIAALSVLLRPAREDTVDVYEVTRGDISETITSSGNVTTNGNTTVFSPSTGIVETMYVNNGDTVTQGQKLLKIKSTATDIERSAALAAYQAAKNALSTSQQAKIVNQSQLEAGRKAVIDASVALAQLTDRLNNSTNNPATNKQYTPDEIESVKSSYISAKKSFEALEGKYTDSGSAISAAQSSVTTKLLSYQATLDGVIKAPTAGMIMNIAVEPGDSVSAITSADTSAANNKPVLRISTLDTISIKVSLSEIDIAKVREGQKATVFFDAIPEKVFDATVSRVDGVGTNTNAVVTYDVYISLVESDDRIRPGMSATATIQTDAKTGVLLVPNIGLKKDANEITVEVQDGTSSTPKTVRIGVKNSLQSEVLSGLSEGEKILIPKSK
ncbi:HlyD family efflux transporter periplasmic adaptor subunit [Candidatus Woesebacteria bacterium]|nr:HlyD family efflux transporter periplasmic adaptor subunit [Candidatus Woesebacteria bacterium]